MSSYAHAHASRKLIFNCQQLFSFQDEDIVKLSSCAFVLHQGFCIQFHAKLSHFMMCILYITNANVLGSLFQLWYVQYPEEGPWYELLIIPLRFELLCSIMIPISIKVRIRVRLSGHVYVCPCVSDVQIMLKCAITFFHGLLHCQLTNVTLPGFLRPCEKLVREIHRLG